MTTTATERHVPGLSASPGAPLSFSDAIHVRRFRLERPGGDDVLVYAAPGATDAEGATRQYLGHWHEAAEGDPAAGAQVIVHAADAAKTGSRFHVRAAFDRGFHLGDDFQAIPIPGHTPGSTAYLWTTGELRVLFTADSLYPDADGEWRAAMLASSDRAAYVDSLQRLRDVPFDVLAPWAAPAGHPGVVHVSRHGARDRIGAVIERLRAGQDG